MDSEWTGIEQECERQMEKKDVQVNKDWIAKTRKKEGMGWEEQESQGNCGWINLMKSWKNEKIEVQKATYKSTEWRRNNVLCQDCSLSSFCITLLPLKRNSIMNMHLTDGLVVKFIATYSWWIYVYKFE